MSCQIYLKSLKMFFMNKFLLFLETFSLNIKLVPEKAQLRLRPQSCLVAVIGKFKKSLDQGGEYATLLTDLSKALNCLPHDLIIAKLHTYGFDNVSLRLMHSYLTGRYQRAKINDFSIFAVSSNMECLKVQF